MSMQRLVHEQRKNSQICMEILMHCETRQQTIAALDKVARILRASDDPVAEAAEQAFQLSQSMDEASVLNIRDEFIGKLSAFLAATESIATESTATIAPEKLSSTAESAKPKGKKGCLIAACGGIILVIALIAIAAVVFTLPPEPSVMLPTKAPIPTPVPTPIPTPVPTPIPPIPTPDFSPIMAPVIRGEGIEEAAQYDPDGLGSHRLLVLTDSGSAHEWNELLPGNWVPSSVNEIDLVVLVHPEREIELDTQSYTGGPPITRYRFETDVEVREARTASTLWEGVIKGSMPREFPQTAPVEKIRLTGSSVSAADLEEWLSCRFFAPEECEYRILGGHTSVVVCMAFSPDGQTLASGSGEVRLWRLSDSALLRTMGESGGKVAFSPDGQTLAALSNDGVRLWRISDGTLLRTLDASKVTSMAFSPDGQILASGSRDDAIVRLWRVSDGTPLRTLDASKVTSMAFSPDGQILASGSGDENIVRLWQVSNGTLLRVFEGHRHPVLGVAISPDGQILASASIDLYVHLWQISDGTLLRKLFGHSNTVTSVAFSPDGQTLASGSTDQTVRLWRVSDGTPLRTIELTSYVFCVAFSPDGQILAAGAADQAVHLWRIE